MKKPVAATSVAVLIGWALMLFLVPLGVGYAVGGIPLRMMSSGILFDQSAVSLVGYRLIVWSPVVMGTLLSLLALNRPPSRFLTALGITGATIAATLLLLGGVFGIGPGGTLLVGTDLRWIWKLCAAGAGVSIGLVGPLLIKARAEDHNLDFRGIRRDMLLTAVVLGALILIAAPGPMLGKVMTGAGSWMGSLAWVLGL